MLNDDEQEIATMSDEFSEEEKEIDPNEIDPAEDLDLLSDEPKSPYDNDTDDDVDYIQTLMQPNEEEGTYAY